MGGEGGEGGRADTVAADRDSEGSDGGGTAVIIGVAVVVALILILGSVVCFLVKTRSAGGSDEGGRSGVVNAAYDPGTDGFGFGAGEAQGYLEVDGTQTKR